MTSTEVVLLKVDYARIFEHFMKFHDAEIVEVHWDEQSQ